MTKPITASMLYDYVQCPHAPVDEISMIDLEGKKLKTVKHCFVD